MTSELAVIFLVVVSGTFDADYVSVQPWPSKVACLQPQSVGFENHQFILRGPGRSGVLTLRNGKTEDDGYGSTDWVTTLEDRQRLELAGENGPVWAVEIFSNHIGGSGSYSRLVVVSCRNGSLTELVQAGGEGMRVKLLEDGGMILTFGVWYPQDAHCCPSAQKTLILHWNARRRIF